MAAPDGYARVAVDEDAYGRPQRARTLTAPPGGLQWTILAALTLTAGIVLAFRVARPPSTASSGLALPSSNGSAVAPLPVRRRDKGWRYPLSMGRMGTSSTFVMRSKRSRRKQKDKAASVSVVLIGSHFPLANELLKRVFGELCQRPRLALRCEASWGGPHDLKALASFKGRSKRLVWLESDATRLRSTLRGVRMHASDFRLVHLLWDPVQACAAQWPHTQSGANVSLASLCAELRLDEIPLLYKRAKRDRHRATQLHLEALLSRRPAVGAAAWRSLFKFLELPEASAFKAADLVDAANHAISELELRSRALNRDAPPWVLQAINSNSTLHDWLRHLRTELDYHPTRAAGHAWRTGKNYFAGRMRKEKQAGGGGGGGGGDAAGGAAMMRR